MLMLAVKTLQSELSDLKSELYSHPLYESVDTADKAKLFMQTHVFAVWDFMCLLKTLQGTLTCVDNIWVPTSNSKLRRFINEIALDEESDYDRHGEPLSHFEMYVNAMQKAGADIAPINNFIWKIRNGEDPLVAIEDPTIPAAAREFVKSTLQAIKTSKPHVVAAFFTHGREDVIPDMFIALLDSLEKTDAHKWQDLAFYFRRHIELDGGSHGDIARLVIQELCGNDQQKIDEAYQAGCDAVKARIKLWDMALADYSPIFD